MKPCGGMAHCQTAHVSNPTCARMTEHIAEFNPSVAGPSAAEAVQGLKHLMCVQVHLYLPSQDHPAHDTVRAIVKDDTDVFDGDSSRVWIDSGARSQQR